VLTPYISAERWWRPHFLFLRYKIGQNINRRTYYLLNTHSRTNITVLKLATNPLDIIQTITTFLIISAIFRVFWLPCSNLCSYT
jgi:hypothetical protein